MCVSYLCPIKTALNAQQNYIGRICLETSLGSPVKTRHYLFVLGASSLMIFRWRCFFFQPKKKEKSQQIFWNTPKILEKQQQQQQQQQQQISWLRHWFHASKWNQVSQSFVVVLGLFDVSRYAVCGRWKHGLFSDPEIAATGLKLAEVMTGDFWWGSRRNKHRVKTIAQNHVLEHIIGETSCWVWVF